MLVLPGYPTWHEQELGSERATAGVTDDVRFPGGSPRRELEGLWAIAAGFVFPSLYEGFGLPVLEAMARGVRWPARTPRRCRRSRATQRSCSIRMTRHAIAAAVGRLLGDLPEAERLRAAGRARAQEFTLGAHRRRTLASYARALGGRSSSSTVSSEVSSDRRYGVFAEPRGVLRAVAGPARWTRTIASAIDCRIGAERDRCR